MEEFAAKTYRQGPQVLLAACDAALLGRRLAEGRFRLEVRSSFYDGDRVDRDDLARLMHECTVANLVGDRTVALATSLGLVEDGNVIHVEGVPHAQFMVLDP